MQTKTFKVPNISCGHCVMAIQNEVGEMDGIVMVEADEKNKMVTVEWSTPASWESIKALLEEINYAPEAA